MAIFPMYVNVHLNRVLASRLPDSMKIASELFQYKTCKSLKRSRIWTYLFIWLICLKSDHAALRIMMDCVLSGDSKFYSIEEYVKF